METETSASSSSSSSKQSSGQKRVRESTRHPTYRGVRERKGGRWVCEVREPLKKTRIWLGTFPTLVMAARAHDVAAIALRGVDSARLNFPDSAWTLPRSVSSSAEDIRRAACDAAEMYRGGEESRVWELGLDEEMVFNMPALVDGMAEGMMLTPPAMKKGFDWDHDGGSALSGGASLEGCSLWNLD